MAETTERTEYRVVQVREGREVKRYFNDYGRKRDDQERLADHIRRFAGGDVRVQTRTVTETPWVDLDEQVANA